MRLNPYQVLFKARDEHPEVSLTNFKTVSIRVIAPPIENLTAEALGNGIELNWNNAPCDNAIEFRIYRRNGSSGLSPAIAKPAFPLTQAISSLNVLKILIHLPSETITAAMVWCLALIIAI